MKQFFSFLAGFLVGLTALTLSMGAVRDESEITDDTALYQELSEIRTGRTPEKSYDAELARLAALEARYQERLPIGGIAPQKRVVRMSSVYTVAPSSKVRGTPVTRRQKKVVENHRRHQKPKNVRYVTRPRT